MVPEVVSSKSNILKMILMENGVKHHMLKDYKNVMTSEIWVTFLDSRARLLNNRYVKIDVSATPYTT